MLLYFFSILRVCFLLLVLTIFQLFIWYNVLPRILYGSSTCKFQINCSLNLFRETSEIRKFWASYGDIYPIMYTFTTRGIHSIV